MGLSHFPDINLFSMPWIEADFLPQGGVAFCLKRCPNSLLRISKESHRLGLDHGSTVIALPTLISRASLEVPGSRAGLLWKRVTSVSFLKKERGRHVTSACRSLHERVLVMSIIAFQDGWTRSSSHWGGSLSLDAILPWIRAPWCPFFRLNSSRQLQISTALLSHSALLSLWGWSSLWGKPHSFDPLSCSVCSHSAVFPRSRKGGSHPFMWNELSFVTEMILPKD